MTYLQVAVKASAPLVLWHDLISFSRIWFVFPLHFWLMVFTIMVFGRLDCLPVIQWPPWFPAIKQSILTLYLFNTVQALFRFMDSFGTSRWYLSIPGTIAFFLFFAGNPTILKPIFSFVFYPDWLFFLHDKLQLASFQLVWHRIYLLDCVPIIGPTGWNMVILSMSFIRIRCVYPLSLSLSLLWVCPRIYVCH